MSDQSAGKGINVHFSSLQDFQNRAKAELGTGPICIVLCEDAVEISSTLCHQLGLGFGAVIAFLRPTLPIPDDIDDPRLHTVALDWEPHLSLPALVNQLMTRMAGRWINALHNSEYLFYPYMETRSVGDLTRFCDDERRRSVFTPTIDLFAPNLAAAPNGVTLKDAHLDVMGYFSLGRWVQGKALKRQAEIYGGLHLRFEHHIKWEARQLGQASLVKAHKDLRLGEDRLWSDLELNTTECKWHRSPSGTLMSFRAAKALRGNPGARGEVDTLTWQGSKPFKWSSTHLKELGLLETGQWF